MPTVTIPCVGDTYLAEADRHTAYGSAPQVIVAGKYDMNFYHPDYITYGHKRRGVLFFDLSELRYKKITNSILNIHVVGSHLDDRAMNDQIDIYRPTENAAGTMTWYNGGKYEVNYLGSVYDYVGKLNGVTTPTWSATSLGTKLGLKVDGLYMLELRIERFTGRSIAISSIESGTPSTLTITYEDAPPNAPENISPTNAYVDSSKAINFSWTHSSTYGGAQTKYNLEWRKLGTSTWNVITQTTTSSNYSMPANTFPEGTIEWRVRTYDQNNIAGAYATGVLYVANYTTIPPNPPKELVPNGIYLDSNKVIKFAWLHSPTYGGAQLKFDLEWRKLGTTPWTVVTQTTASNFYNMPASTLPSGNIEWRVRTYDQNSNASNYSVSKFYSIGAPAKPTIISVKNSCLTEIKWSSEEQDIYELLILKDDLEVYYTGEKAGYNTFSHKPNLFLDNGTYTVKIRIRNSYGFYSDYAETIFSISTNKPNTPSLYISQSDKGVLINTEFETDKAVLFRSDGEEVAMVAILDSNTYLDHIVQPGKFYEYFVRAYDTGYEDSEGKTVTVNYDGVKIYPTESKLPIVIDKSLDVPYIPRNYSKSNPINLVNYIGREYPVKEYGGYKNMASSIVGYATKEQKKILSEIYDNNEVVCYLSADEKMYSIITKLNYSNAFLEQGFEISMEFTRVDYDEEVIVNA